MDSIKVVAMVSAPWGFVSYAYQQHVDTHEFETEVENINVGNEA